MSRLPNPLGRRVARAANERRRILTQVLTDLVFLSPITPSASGVGLAMRAHRLVQALAPSYRIHLRVIPIQEPEPASGGVDYPGPCVSQRRIWLEPGLIHRLRHRRHGEIKRLAPRLYDALHESLSEVVPDIVFSFRHCLLQLGLEFRTRAASTARMIVDLDEMESHTRERLAALHADRGETRAAALLRDQADHFRMREARELAEVDGVWLCSEVESRRLRAATGVEAAVVPNVVELPSDVTATPESGDLEREGTAPAVLLFVGSLAYLPNLDAAEWIVEQVLPILEEGSARPVQFRIVGKATSEAMRRVADHPSVDWRGYVESLGPQYAESDLCLVPLRAGGGTRIKLLEALAHARPVVSTSVGSEGLAVGDGSELRISDSPEGFAAACRELLDDPVEAGRLADRGRRLVAERYAPEAMRAAVRAALGSPA